VTEAFIAAGCPLDQLIVVERDADLCRMLSDRFRGLHVLHGDALEIGAMLARAQVSSIGAVLCGLPMRAVRRDAAAQCYAEAFDLMPAGGTIIQYTYGFKSPVDPDAPTLKLDARFVGREWRNVPPMGIWSYRRAGEKEHDGGQQVNGGGTEFSCNGAR
jgi:phosphatidylethanolamine/phosphatidyl-N-methylethanolamine N-methyltransferase